MSHTTAPPPVSGDRFKIVVGYDFSSQSALALDRGIWLASGFDDAEIHVCSALTGNVSNPDYPKVEKTAEGADQVRKHLFETIEARLAFFEPPSVHTFVHTWLEDGKHMILKIASDIHADLIIVGTHSKRGLVRAVLGSVSEKIVRAAHCPVMVVRETAWAANLSTEIEPPCPRCLAARQETAGKDWWCSDHDHAPPYSSPLRTHVQHDPGRSRQMAWPMY